MVWISFIVSLFLSLLFIPLVRKFSLRIGKVSIPRSDRWHRQPTPTLGGVGIFLAFSMTVILVILLWRPLSIPVVGRAGQEQPLWTLLIAPVLMFFLGLYDDFKRISPPTKLVGQILAASLAVAFGYTTNFFTPKIADSILAQLPNILLTFIWLIGITNAINLLDNMDGLAGGITFITACILSFFFWQANNLGLLAFSLALAGCVLGFLVFNFPPASIFMGDSGSMFLGFTLAILAIAKQPRASNVFAVMGVPTLLFLLPILDTVLVTITRVMRGQSPAQGGRDHTSHRLIAFGLSERQAVLVLYGVAVIAGLGAIIGETFLSSVSTANFRSLGYWMSLVFVFALVIVFALLTAYLGGMKVVVSERKGLDSSSAAPVKAATIVSGRGRALSRMIIELTYKRRLFEVVLDFFLIGLAYLLAFLTRYGFVLAEVQFEIYLQTLPIALASAYLSMYALGVYRGVWRYVGLNDLARFFAAALICVILAGITLRLIYPQFGVDPAILFLFGLFLFLELAASRSSFRLLDVFSTQLRYRQAQSALPARDLEQPGALLIQSGADENDLANGQALATGTTNTKAIDRTEKKRIFIYGAGDAGEIALRWISMNPGLEYYPIGFIDEDPYMEGRQIHGVSVYNRTTHLQKMLEAHKLDGIIATREIPPDIIEMCRQSGCWVRKLRLEFEEVEVGNDEAI